MEEKDKKGKKGFLYKIKRFLPYYKNYRRTLVFDLICAALTTICELVLPMIVRQITNAANGEAELTIRLILGCALGYFVLRIIDALAYFYMSSVGHVMGTKIETDMRRDLFSHYQKLSFSFYDNTKIGTLMSRITSDLFDVTEFAHHCPEEFFIAGIKIIGSFAVLCFIDIPLTLITFALIPVMVVVLTKFNVRMRDNFREQRKRIGELNSQVEDSLLGIHEVHAYGNEGTETRKFEEGNKSFLDIKKKSYTVMGGFHASNRFFNGLLYFIVVCVGALFIYYGVIDSGDYIAYLLYVTTLITSVSRIVEFAEQFYRGMTGIDRFTEILDIQPDIQNKEGAYDIGAVQGDISMKNVSFRYSEENRNVLTELSLDIKAGESIALVGPSGGGKTTLCSLLPRFYEITGGTITVDGNDIHDVTLESLRRNIGIVQQDVYLFSGSVRENIEYGKPGATDEEIEAAAKLAGAHEFISELADGYDTYVGERGVKLSGGQKQRISIARVFLKNPPILILDEATSALDNESERLVQQSLERLSKGRTTITIAHRLTTIRSADRIVVLTEDGIAEQGSHDALIEKNGIYAQLYKLYSV